MLDADVKRIPLVAPNQVACDSAVVRRAAIRSAVSPEFARGAGELERPSRFVPPFKNREEMLCLRSLPPAVRPRLSQSRILRLPVPGCPLLPQILPVL